MHSQNCEKRLLDLSCLSVCLSARNILAPTGRFTLNCYILIIFENLLIKFKVSLKSVKNSGTFNPLNPELNPICYLLALLAHHFLHVSRIKVKSLTIRLLMSYIYGAPILDVSRSHTTTQHSR